jgi:hypothetical protein
MAAEQSKPKGPDLARGVPLGDVADGGMVGGHVGDDAVLLARRATNCSRSARRARTTAARSPKD